MEQEPPSSGLMLERQAACYIACDVLVPGLRLPTALPIPSAVRRWQFLGGMAHINSPVWLGCAQCLRHGWPACHTPPFMLSLIVIHVSSLMLSMPMSSNVAPVLCAWKACSGWAKRRSVTGACSLARVWRASWPHRALQTSCWPRSLPRAWSLPCGELSPQVSAPA